MKAILLSLSKYPAKNIIYTALLTVAFATVNVLISAYLTGQSTIEVFNQLQNSISYEEYSEKTDLFNIQSAIQVSMSSLIPLALLLILLCIFVIPFTQYLFSQSRGYEIGILRALGMSKGRAWLKLFSENLTLVIAALFFAQGITLFVSKGLALSLLTIDNEAEQAMISAFSNLPSFTGVFGFNWTVSLFMLCLAFVLTLITAGLSNTLVSSNAPLKLIRNYK